MKYLIDLFLGTFLALLAVIVSRVIWKDIHMVSTLTSCIGLFFIVIAFILSGVLVSGDRMRLNLATESAESRNQRIVGSLHSTMIAIPNFVVAILFYFLSK